MSDARYAAHVGTGCALSAGGQYRLMRWPEALPGLGALEGGRPFARCAFCGPEVPSVFAWTFCAYGGTPVCEGHAAERAASAA